MSELARDTQVGSTLPRSAAIVRPELSAVPNDELAVLARAAASDEASKLYLEASGRPGASIPPGYEGSIVRLPSERYPGLGVYVLHPDLASTHIPGYHSTCSELARRIEQGGCSLSARGEGTFFHVDPRVTFTRQGYYATIAAYKLEQRVMEELFDHPDRARLAADSEAALSLAEQLAGTLELRWSRNQMACRLPRDLAELACFGGATIEALLPLDRHRDNFNGEVRDGVFSGYEFEAKPLPASLMLKRLAIETSPTRVPLTIAQCLARFADYSDYAWNSWKVEASS